MPPDASNHANSPRKPSGQTTPAVRRFYLLRGCTPAVQQTARPPDAIADSLLYEP